MSTTQEIMQLAERCGFDHVGELNMAALEFLPAVREMCAAGKCRKYGTSWTCPPGCGTLEEAAAQAARTELLPEATGFTLVEGEFEGVTEIYTADNGVGTIITSSDKGYSSTVVVMVAFDPDGTIKQVKIQSQGETAGVGTKIENESFWSQYTGLPAETITLDQQVDRITGASISSSAVNDAVNFAIAAYNAIS